MGTLRHLTRDVEVVRCLTRGSYSIVRSTTEEQRVTNAKSFREIPGPRGLYSVPIIGSVLLFSKYSFPKAHLVFRELYEKYGKIVKVRMGLTWSVILFDPNLIYNAVSNEGKYPVRMSPPLLKVYSERNGNKQSLSNSQGEIWQKLRSIIQHKLKTSVIAQYIPIHCSCADDLVQWLKVQKDDNYDLEDTIRRYVADAVVAVGFNVKLGFLKDKGKSEESEEFLKSAREMMVMIGKSFYMFPFYRFYRTPFYKKFEEAARVVYGFGHKRTEEATEGLIETINDEKELSILKSLLADDSLQATIIPDLMTGMIFAGLETTTRPVIWIFWLLGLNPDKQQRVYEELCRNLPDGKITAERLSYLPYLKACVKESFRFIFPTINGSLRLMPKDTVLHDFHVPKGTYVHFGHNALCRSTEYFESPDLFNPERWLPGANDPETHRLMSLCVQPFGIGKRNCAGRRIAEQLIYITLIKILQNFELRVPADSRDVGLSYYTFAVPEKPIKIQFIKR